MTLSDIILPKPMILIGISDDSQATEVISGTVAKTYSTCDGYVVNDVVYFLKDTITTISLGDVTDISTTYLLINESKILFTTGVLPP